jgi:drug/metabolite transporter (DMT)-like permease
VLLWPTELLVLRLRRWNQPWPQFWRRHLELLRQTAQMVEHQTLQLTTRQQERSPWPYMLRTTIFVTCALTVAGASWYVAVDLTTSGDLTAIYNCSAFFAYVFSVPLLNERVRADKVFAVAVAIVGVLVVAYGGQSGAKHGGKSGGAGGVAPPVGGEEPRNRFLGNVIIGVGSVLYGLYEVLYKKLACPPDDTSPGRGMLFANAVGSMIGTFTLTVLWVPLPVLHFLGWETFQLPRGEQAWMMVISVLSNTGLFLLRLLKRGLILSSFLGVVSHPYQFDVPGFVVGGRITHHLHHRHHRPVPPGRHVRAAIPRGFDRRASHHFCVCRP